MISKCKPEAIPLNNISFSLWEHGQHIPVSDFDWWSGSNRAKSQIYHARSIAKGLNCCANTLRQPPNKARGYGIITKWKKALERNHDGETDSDKFILENEHRFLKAKQQETKKVSGMFVNLKWMSFEKICLGGWGEKHIQLYRARCNSLWHTEDQVRWSKRTVFTPSR